MDRVIYSLSRDCLFVKHLNCALSSQIDRLYLVDFVIQIFVLLRGGVFQIRIFSQICNARFCVLHIKIFILQSIMF